MKLKFLSLAILLLLRNDLNAQDYLPLNVGNTWIYHQIDTNGNTVRVDSSVITDNYFMLNLNVFEWIDYYTPPLFFNDSSINQFYNDTINSNDVYVINSDSSTRKFFQHQYNGGEQWMSGADSVTVSYVGQVTVPAGIFDSCYMTHSPTGFGAGVEVSYVFAPDVGSIKVVVGGYDYSVLVNYSVTVGINSAYTNDAEIRVYPNPTSGILNIGFHNPDIHGATIKIVDVMGKEVNETFIGNAPIIQLDISLLRNGFYFVSVITEQHQATVKLLKQ